jgi:hypothetical protein
MTAPGLAFEGILKYTKIEVERLESYEMLLILENGVRGEICQPVTRYSKANLPKIDGINYNGKNLKHIYLISIV